MFKISKNAQKLGMTYDRYVRLFVDQGGVCAICGDEEKGMCRDGTQKSLCVDHDHESGYVRGLLCSHCNTLLGMAREDKDTLQAAIDYLEDHGK